MLAEIYGLVNDWARKWSEEEVCFFDCSMALFPHTLRTQFGMSAEDAAEVRLAVFAFGSYRLGVNSQGAFLKSLLFSA